MQIFNFNRKPSKAASDFWMADSYEMKSRKKDEDIMELSSYRRAVSNFVRIVTGDNIPVRYSTGNDSYTDGRTVTISASTKLDERDSMVGLALHEGSHIKLTDYKLVRDVFGNSDIEHNGWMFNNGLRPRVQKMLRNHGGEWDSYAMTGYLKDLFNYVEDRRIDNFVMTQAPGYMPYYQALYDRYFNNKIVTKGLQSGEFRNEVWESYLFRLMNITNPASDLKALKGLQKIWDMLDLEHIDRLDTSMKSMMLAFDILETIHDSIQKSKQEEQQKQDQKDQKKQDQKDKESKGNSKGMKSDNEKSDDDRDPMDGGGDDEGEGGSEGGSKSKGDDKKEKKEKPKKDESDLKDDPTDPGEGEEDGTDGSGGLDEESEDESESENDSDSESDEGEGEDGDDGEDQNHDLPKLSLSDMGRLKKQIQEQKNLQSGNIKKKKMAAKTSDMISAIDDSDVSIEEVPVITDGRMANFKVTVVRKFNRKLAETTDSNMWTGRPPKVYEDAIADGIRMGTVLGKKLKVRAEERSTKFNRLRSGRIDKRMISQAGFGAEGIFEKIESFAYRPGIIHMSIDSSGSMSGDKFKRSLVCASAIAKACSMIENLDCVISFRSTGQVGSGSNNMAMIVVAYDSTKQSISEMKKLLPMMTANGGTPEGLCFDATMKDILGQAKGKDAYFVNFSDGSPYHAEAGVNGSYNGEVAYDHTRKQINKMKANGLKVLSYFISEYSNGGSDRRAFERMYGKDAQFIDVKSINEVAKTMNAKFLEINN